MYIMNFLKMRGIVVIKKGYLSKTDRRFLGRDDVESLSIKDLSEEGFPSGRFSQLQHHSVLLDVPIAEGLTKIINKDRILVLVDNEEVHASLLVEGLKEREARVKRFLHDLIRRHLNVGRIVLTFALHVYVDLDHDFNLEFIWLLQKVCFLKGKFVICDDYLTRFKKIVEAEH